MDFLEWIKSLFQDKTFGAGRDSRWPKIRAEYLSKHPWCEICGGTKDLEIHHCTPVHVDKSQELLEKNLITLCSDDHFNFGHLRNFRSWNEDIKKDSVIWRQKILNRP